MELRPLAPGEERAVSRVYALSWKTAYRGIVPDSFLNELPEDRWVPLLSPPSTLQSLALWEGDACIGTAAVAPARAEERHGFGELVSLYVLPAYWSRGCGRLLLHAALDLLRQSGYKECYLWVLEQNGRARGFYERNGFSPTGESMEQEVGGAKLTELCYACKLDKTGGNTE